ncbi:hypothetical protein GCM10009736_52860 [Actinomadura bangladeshensis]
MLRLSRTKANSASVAVASREMICSRAGVWMSEAIHRAMRVPAFGVHVRGRNMGMPDGRRRTPPWV